MLKWIEWKWGLAMILYPSKEELVFWVHTLLHGPLRCRKLETVLYCSFRNNTSIIHWENTNITGYVEEYSCNLLETAECKFSPGFLDKNRRIQSDRWRMNKSTSNNFYTLFYLFLFAAYEVMQCDHSIDSLQHNRHCFFVFILFPKKIYDLTVSMVLEIVYQK